MKIIGMEAPQHLGSSVADVVENGSALDLPQQLHSSVIDVVRQLSECRDLISGMKSRSHPESMAKNPPRRPTALRFNARVSMSSSSSLASSLTSEAEENDDPNNAPDMEQGASRQSRPRSSTNLPCRPRTYSHASTRSRGSTHTGYRSRSSTDASFRSRTSRASTRETLRRASVETRLFADVPERSSIISALERRSSAASSEVSSVSDDDESNDFRGVLTIGEFPSSSRSRYSLISTLSVSTLQKPLLARATTYGNIVSHVGLEPIMCEVEYPWMYTRPILFLSKLPSDFTPDRDETTCDLKQRISPCFGSELLDDITMVHFCTERDVGDFYKIFFRNILSTHRAKLASEDLACNVSVTFTKPGKVARRQCDLFISKFAQDSKHALTKYLASCGDKPAHVTRLEADYDPGNPDPKKLTWRVKYDDEEAARSAHAALSLLRKIGGTAHAFDVSYQPEPFTKGLIICFRTPGISKIVLQKLKLHDPQKACLVEEFEYAIRPCDAEGDSGESSLIDRGDIFYDIKDRPDDSHGYARLVTSNWWYAALFWALIYSSLAVLDLYSNFLYAASLFGKKDRFSCNTDFRYNFIVSFFGLQLFLLRSSWLESLSNIKMQVEGSGDLIACKTLADRVILQCASLTFSFLQIPGMVKEIVKTLHPWTNVQEKVAAKMYGTRLFIIGYPHANMYRCNDQAGMHKQYPPLMLCSFVLTAFKVWHAYTTGRWITIALCSTSIVLWPTQLFSFLQLLNDRVILVSYLSRQAKSLRMETDSIKALRSKKSSMTAAEKAVLNTWEKYFGDFESLSKYSRLWDATPWDFWQAIAILAIANGCILFLHLFGVLEFCAGSAPLVHHAISSAGISLSDWQGADLDGDGRLSAAELSRIGLLQVSRA